MWKEQSWSDPWTPVVAFLSRWIRNEMTLLGFRLATRGRGSCQSWNTANFKGNPDLRRIAAHLAAVWLPFAAKVAACWPEKFCEVDGVVSGDAVSWREVRGDEVSRSSVKNSNGEVTKDISQMPWASWNSKRIRICIVYLTWNLFIEHLC